MHIFTCICIIVIDYNTIIFTDNLGANAILGVSMAVCRAGAAKKVMYCKRGNFRVGVIFATFAINKYP